jgi:hypothetical protein
LLKQNLHSKAKLRKTFLNSPLFAQKMHCAGERVGILIFLLHRNPCKISEPGEKQKAMRRKREK